MERDERSYEAGSRAAWAAMLSTCLERLGYDSPEAKAATWASYEEEIRATLRRVCEDYGDNDWPDDLHLVDVIEKHLVRHLPDPDGKE